MLIKKLFALSICFAPDDLGGGGNDTAAADASASAAADATQTDTGTQDKQTANEEKAPDYKALYEARTKENARLARTVQNFQKRTETKTEPQTKGINTGDTGDTEATLRAHGLKPDADGFVNYKGLEVSAEFALADIARDQQLSDLQSSLQAQRDSETQAEHNNALNEVFTGFQSMCEDFAKVALPGLEGEAQTRMARIIGREARVVFADMRAEHGDTGITIEMMQEAAAEIIEDHRKNAMSVISKQLKNNQQYAENHPTKPNGQAGYTAPKPLEQMSKHERKAHIAQLTKMATPG